jgi:hypothetical protein
MGTVKRELTIPQAIYGLVNEVLQKITPKRKPYKST